MENNALATDPKAGMAATRSASIATQDQDTRSLLSVHIPAEALGMSLGDFWAFVTRDYTEALAAMPTMTPIMIRKGIPDFLRPVVWSGLAGARDESLYAEFDVLLERLEYEQCNSENIIDKDVGRCFPAHELFMQPGGDGQKMLGQILRCYSLHDPDTGYCQGMGFIVGILLMKMEVKDAFCVFVRLMEQHGLKSSYSKSLSGLHSRIYQFQQLLSPLAPALLSHFKNLGVEFAYLSQWFMTIFATTCPLGTLFRLYDVILAEGANETIMRVALALILKNEQKLLSMVELEDVLQLLLGRDIWEPYENNPDQLIEEVTTLFTQVVTKQTLDKLHRQFQTQSEGAGVEKTARALGFGGLHNSAFRIFDNWWAPSKSTSLSPGAFLRRTTSKQSLSTINSLSGGSGADSLASTDSYASTAPTEVDRDPERDSATPTKMHRSMIRQEDRNLHEQVEGLLMALSEVQREAAQTAADLRKEQARRTEAQDVVGDLIQILHQKKAVDAYRRQRRITLPSRITTEETTDELKQMRRRSNFVKSVTKSIMSGTCLTLDGDAGLQTSLLKLCALLDAEETLFQKVDRKSIEEANARGELATNEQIQQLEEELTRLRRKLVRDRLQRHSRRTSDLKDVRKSLRSLKLGKSHTEPIRTRRSLYQQQENNRPLVHEPPPPSPSPSRAPSLSTITVPRVRARQLSSASRIAFPVNPALRIIRTQDGRETPAPQKFSKRTSSLVTRPILATSDQQPPPDETLLVELVSAKTREATAIHERDEMKVQLDKLRRGHEAREADLRAKMEAMESLMQAQMQAHAAELERIKAILSTSGTPGTPSSIVPSPGRTPDLVLPNSAAGKPGGWSWFGKGRSVSTGNASSIQSSSSST